MLSAITTGSDMAMRVPRDKQWSMLEPLLDEARPWAARPIRELRRTMKAIVWQQQNGAKWRSIPAELGLLGSHRRGSRSCGDG